MNANSFQPTDGNLSISYNLIFVCLNQPLGTIVLFSHCFLKPEVWVFTSTSSPIWVEISCVKRVTSQGNLQKTTPSSIASYMQRCPKKIPLMRRKRFSGGGGFTFFFGVWGHSIGHTDCKCVKSCSSSFPYFPIDCRR